jgi:hypothetical protein
VPTAGRRRLLAAAGLIAFLSAAAPARADVGDGGAPADATQAVTIDAGAGPDGAPPPVELARQPESPSAAANRVATMMLATPAPVDAEPPRPITRRLWFWMAITGVIAAGVLIGVAVHDPNRTRPECPPDYVCPL